MERTSAVHIAIAMVREFKGHFRHFKPHFPCVFSSFLA